MNTLHALRVLGLAGLGGLLAAPAFAQDGGYPYVGLSVGGSQAKIDDDRITSTLLGAGLATTAMSRDEKDLAYKLFAGYQFNRSVAIEGGYFNLGKFGFESTTAPAGTLSGRIKLQGANLDLVGTLWMSERWALIGRVGGQYASAHDKFSGTGAVNVLDPSPSKSGFNYKAGLGLQYEVTSSLRVRAEAERYRVNDAVGNRGDINLYSVSLVFPFGRPPVVAARAAPPPPPVAAAPAPVAVIAAAPPPVVAAPVVVPARRRVSFSADSLFAFDQSVIGPDGRAALDRFAAELKGSQFEMITVEGHTDRLGSDAYNQRLSERRAAAVKDYLIAKGGIDSARISAVGKGESTAVTQPGECKGAQPSPALVACLQPDRRVEVEVSATR